MLHETDWQPPCKLINRPETKYFFRRETGIREWSCLLAFQCCETLLFGFNFMLFVYCVSKTRRLYWTNRGLDIGSYSHIHIQSRTWEWGVSCRPPPPAFDIPYFWCWMLWLAKAKWGISVINFAYHGGGKISSDLAKLAKSHCTPLFILYKNKKKRDPPFGEAKAKIWWWP